MPGDNAEFENEAKCIASECQTEYVTSTYIIPQRIQVSMSLSPETLLARLLSRRHRAANASVIEPYALRQQGSQEEEQNAYRQIRVMTTISRYSEENVRWAYDDDEPPPSYEELFGNREGWHRI